MLIAADDALKSAAEAGDRISEKVDGKFARAIHLLSGFETDFPLKDPTSDPNIDVMVTREEDSSLASFPTHHLFRQAGKDLKRGAENGASESHAEIMSNTPKSPSTILRSLKKNLHANVKVLSVPLLLNADES